jgi:ferredoxin
MPTVTFRDTVVEAAAGEDVLSLLLDGDADINYLCMSGSCGTCCVRVLAGGEHLEPISAMETHRLRVHDGTRRLACQAVCRGSGDIVVAQP